MKWTIRILQGLMAVGFFMASMAKFFAGSEGLTTMYTEPLGYGVGFMYMIGCIEFLAVLCLIIGYWKVIFTVIGSFAIVVVMAGATISVLFSEESIVSAISPFVWFAVALIVFFARLRLIRPIFKTADM
jgi:putative oxidoreductase